MSSGSLNKVKLNRDLDSLPPVPSEPATTASPATVRPERPTTMWLGLKLSEPAFAADSSALCCVPGDVPRWRARVESQRAEGNGKLVKPHLGLVVGKFYPSHRGHKLLIDAATAQSDQAVVIVCAKPADNKCEKQMKINNVIIVINPSKSHAQQTAVALKSFFEREKVRQEWIETFPPQKSLYQKMADLRGRKVDLVIAVGGDGTLLQAAHRFRGSSVPILGINIGYLGFITSIHGNRIKQEMKRILNAEFVVSQRTALDLEIRNGTKRVMGWALNDALITRGGNPHLIGIEARIGQRRLTSYRCDGLVVATPTGSTAYSLAAGGPIISPECNVLTVTPICPQSLTNRSVVVNSTEPIEMQLTATSGPAEVQVDGMKLANLSPASTISVKTSTDTVPIAFLPEINYYDVLAEKLNWRGDGLSKPKYGHA